jgi:CRISPR-associated protein Cas1
MPGTRIPGDERVPDLLPARMIAEFAYCPRLFHLEWVQTEWADSVDTVEGRSGHRRVDTESGDLAPPEDLIESTDQEGVESRVTALMLSAPTTGAITKLDLLEIRNGLAVPIDYKKGAKPDAPQG